MRADVVLKLLMPWCCGLFLSCLGVGPYLGKACHLGPSLALNSWGLDEAVEDEHMKRIIAGHFALCRERDGTDEQ